MDAAALFDAGPRQMRNCLPCRKRKIKCDRKIPCGPCALRNDVDSCTPVVALLEEAAASGSSSGADGGHIPSSAAFRALSQHVEALQRRVRVLEERVGVESDAADAAADAESSTAGRDQDRTQNRDRERDQALDPRSNAASPPRGARAPYTGLSSRRHGPDDEVLFELEDLHQHNRINRLNTLARPREREHIDGGEPRHREYGYRDGSDRGHSLAPDPKVSVRLSRGRMIADGVAVPPRVNYVGAPHPFAFLLPAGTDYIAAALAHLPDQAQCERLVQVFFDKIEWFQRSLHYSTFMDQCRLFWAGTTTTQTLSPDFVVIYVMVICLALTRTAAGSPDVQGTLALADRLYHIAEGVLWCSRFLQRQTFESLQAISLMTIYGFTMEDGADAMWALYGSAIRIGQNLGLNRLEAEERGKTWPPLWSTRMQREMGRRVWWTFAALDWSHASSHGGIYCIHPSQNFTALPANLDDDRLDDNGAELPLDVYTPISMQIFRFKFVTLYREVTDHMATRKIPSYPFIMRMDSELMISAHGLPSHFKNPDKLPLDMPNQPVVDSIFINLTASILRVRLHRSYFLRGYHDKRYTISKERCVQASHDVLRLIELAERRCPVLVSFWTVLFYAFTAAVPACIDFLFEPAPEKRQVVLNVLDTFRKYSVTNASARHSAFVIERLLQVEDMFPSSSPTDNKQKRRRLDEGDASDLDRLQRNIRSILQAAMTEVANSSSSSSATISATATTTAQTNASTGAAQLPMPDIVPVPLPPDAAPVNWELNDQLFGMFEASDILNNLWPQAESIWPLQ